MQDIRWQQRLDNYLQALKTLNEAFALSQKRELSNLEKQGLIQGFEFTHELAWNVVKDYLEYQGITGMVGSRDAIRKAFKSGLLENGQIWMDMIRARNLTSHTYNTRIADDVVDDILSRFYPAFSELAQQFIMLRDKSNSES